MPPPARPSRTPAAVAILAVLVLLALATVALVVLQPRDPVAGGPEVTSSTSDVGGADAAPPDDSLPTEVATTPDVEPIPPTVPPTESPAPEYSPLDPPEQASPGAMVEASAGGKACRTLASRSDYGDYPLAQCTMWHASEGELFGETLSKGPKKITCQRQLDRGNPEFRSGQTNTWWVWTTSDDGTWDWYPETAVAQGASDQPINGIARCEGGS